MTLYNAVPHHRSRIPGMIDTKAQGWTPKSITGLQAWYQANKEQGYSDGNSFSSFLDWSGNNYNLAGTGTYKVVSGVVLIDSDDMATSSRPASGNNPFSFCIYGDTYNTDGTLMGVGNGASDKNSLNVCVDHLYCWNYDPAFTSMGTSAPWYLITVTYDQTYVRIYKNNALHTTLTQGSFNIQSGIYMFRWFFNDRQSTLRARFAAVYSKKLELAEVGYLYNYVSAFQN